MKNFFSRAVVIAAATMLGLIVSGTVARAEVSTPVVELSETGIQSVQWQGRTLTGKGAMSLRSVGFLNADGSVAVADAAEIKAAKITRNSEGFRWSLPWGEIACAVKAEPGQVKFVVTITNRGQRAVDGVALRLFEFQSPNPQSRWGSSGNTIAGPPACWMGTALGEMAWCVEGDLQKPVAIDAGYQEKNQQWSLGAEIGGPKFAADLEPLSRPVQPGQSDSVTLSLRLPRQGMTWGQLVSDVVARFTAQVPGQLSWPDRRPILRTFVGGGLPKEQANANLAQPDQVKPTEKASDAMVKKVEHLTRAVLESAKAADAQGIIVWDIEGDSYQHPITYIGDPRLARLTHPEMDLLADGMFKAWRDAGLRTGVTIRPSAVKFDAKGNTARHVHGGVDPFEQYDAKISYAKQRWGCTIFYLDTSVFWRPPQAGLLGKDGKPAQWDAHHISHRFWQKLMQKHPDVLLVPESVYPAVYAMTAPYMEADMGGWGARGMVRLAWPDSFAVVTIEDVDPSEDASFDRFVQSVREGNILMTHGSGANVRNVRYTALIQQQVKFEKTVASTDLANADLKSLAELSKDADPARRFAAARALGGVQERSAAAALLLKIAGDAQENWVVRRAALQSLAKVPTPESIKPLMRLLMDTTSNLTVPAAAAMGAIGPAAVEPMLAEFNAREGDTKFATEPYCLALARIGDKSAIESLRFLVTTQDSKAMRVQLEPMVETIGVLGQDKERKFLLELAMEKPELKLGVALGLIAGPAHPESNAMIESVLREYRESRNPAAARLRELAKKAGLKVP